MTNTAKHTPTPWMHEHTKDKETNSVDIYNIDGACIATVRSNHGYDVREANAAYIVKAVNCHEQLVEALVRAQCELGDPTPEGIKIALQEINAALAAAEAQ